MQKILFHFVYIFVRRAFSLKTLFIFYLVCPSKLECSVNCCCTKIWCVLVRKILRNNSAKSSSSSSWTNITKKHTVKRNLCLLHCIMYFLYNCLPLGETMRKKKYIELMMMITQQKKQVGLLVLLYCKKKYVEKKIHC